MIVSDESLNENLQDFAARKKEALLRQYSIQIKRNEIEKLDIAVHNEEDRLSAEEAKLEADIKKFDQFLKDNDRLCVEALRKYLDEMQKSSWFRRADTETKARLEKTQELKRSATEAMGIKAELSKNEEILADIRKYREFLLQLTPASWLNEHGIKNITGIYTV